jgi:hypothetical protein
MPDDSKQVAEQQEPSLVPCKTRQEADGMWDEWREFTAEIGTALLICGCKALLHSNRMPVAKNARSSGKGLFFLRLYTVPGAIAITLCNSGR